MEDPGAHELGTPHHAPSFTLHKTYTSPLDASDSDEHFSDAQSGPAESNRTSPIPKTRVEKVDNDPSYGEVPGTEAYRLREGDAEPDEIAVIPDASSKASVSGSEDEPRPTTPGGQPIPITVVEETPDADGAVTHPEAENRRKADTPPDLVLEAESTKSEGSKGASGTDA